MNKPLTMWTDEQAVDATIEVLSEDFTVSTLRSWFKPDPKQTAPGMSEWVSRADHAAGMLQVGRALLDLRAALAAAEAEAATLREFRGVRSIQEFTAERDKALAALADERRHADALVALMESEVRCQCGPRPFCWRCKAVADHTARRAAEVK